MKYSANQRRISSFVVGGTESEYGLPVAVYMKNSFEPLGFSNFIMGIPRSKQGLPVTVIELNFPDNFYHENR
ncbi:hypothetical protein [Desulfocicer vacuolatum]|uniref:hypothetical protein n=1 Tax=Desulfocicer vacuolatum TaxID=2298 RepID=UPI001BB055B4|nr:hypothetical protein [Desulfocicer vacuolatum]